MPADGSGNTSPRHVLVVENILAQAQMLCHILEEEGYRVSIADNGRSALEMTTSLLPALVVSGVKIPEMSGYELCRQIKVDPALRQIPVILVTSLVDPNEVLLGLQCGADSFVIKPYERSHMLARVEHALSTRDIDQAPEASAPAEIFFHGERHHITASRTQILNLLMSTYDAAMQRNDELTESRELLRERTAEVLKSNRFLDSMIEHIPAAVYIKDATHFRYVRVNRAEEDMVGRPREEIIGKCVHDIFSKEEADNFAAQDRRVLASGLLEDIPEDRLLSGANGPRLLHTCKVPVFGDGAEPTHVLGISEDITVRRDLEKMVATLHAALKIRVDDLETTNKSLESFTSAASHDLRSPLSVIAGYAGLLEKNYADRLDEKGLHYLSVIRARVTSMTGLIEDLLTFSRLTLQEVAKTRVDMNALVAQVAAEMPGSGPDTPQPAIALGPLPDAQADPALLRQVWINLLSNAFKYSSRVASPLIEISGRVEDAEAIYSVRDNGAGFDMAYYDKLFEVFERLHGDEEFAGTGVGLATVRRVIMRHGGRLWAEGKVGEGAVFHFALPLQGG
ncbi:MAG: response regulator [Polaromonas sp.]|uniref:ATP-binding protein n=1 Tax=Polaromonas sp. TaxID=1869339 RepID=UPI0017C1F585|nr:ATP-binding protein [Polaromonas sp.]MBA3592647.1 response regulator [Polaromonas sp.]